MKLHESGENYLETILILQRRNGFVRSVDVAHELGYTKASISRAMRILRQDNYITMDHSGQILLTGAGLARAEAVLERHTLITRFLVQTLGVDESTADLDACRIEHVISQETFDRIRQAVSGQGRP